MEIAEKRERMIKEIIDMEWGAFDKVQNRGDRASCQNDFATFEIMRKSQYMTWTEELLESFQNDLKEAEKSGRNLIAEKYAVMMKSTNPIEYCEIKEQIPGEDKEKDKIIDEIVKIQVGWMENFADKFPKLAKNTRNIHTYEDNQDNTSYETYLRGELSTYSGWTLILYGRFVVDMYKRAINLAYSIMSNTVKLYGYRDLEHAEKCEKCE